MNHKPEVIRIQKKTKEQMNKIKINNAKLLKVFMTAIKLSVVAIMLIFTFVGASAEVQAFGFSLFGYHVSNQGIEKENQNEHTQERQVIQEREQIREIEQDREVEEEQNREQVRENNREIQSFGSDSKSESETISETEKKIGEENPIKEVNDIVDIEESLRLVNADKYLTSALKSLEGEKFCIRTDQRLAYFTVNQDGTIGWFDGEPSEYHTIQTTERFLSQASERSRNGEEISQKEIEKNVKIPFKLKAKLVMSNLFSFG